MYRAYIHIIIILLYNYKTQSRFRCAYIILTTLGAFTTGIAYSTIKSYRYTLCVYIGLRLLYIYKSFNLRLVKLDERWSSTNRDLRHLIEIRKGHAVDLWCVDRRWKRESGRPCNNSNNINATAVGPDTVRLF